MDRQYTPLEVRSVRQGALLCNPERGFLRRVGPDDPATQVMTDFMIIPAATVDAFRSIDDAAELMKMRGVRLLFVQTPAGEITGLITETDLIGEKPMHIVRERGISHGEVLVTDIMTPAALFEAVDYEQALHAKTGQIIATIRRLGRQHLMVVEFNPRGAQTIRGLFSLSQIARQLGIELATTGVANTFMEIEAALAR